MAGTAGLNIVIGANVQGAIQGINQVKTSLTGLSGVTSKASQGISSGFSRISASLSNFGASIKSSLGSAKDLLFSLISPQELFLVAAVGIGAAIYKWASAITYAQEQQQALNKTLGEAIAKGQTEVVMLNSLVNVASNESLSRDARTEALKKLQKEYPGYFESIKFDGKLTENLKKATDDLTRSILLNAKAKGLQKALEDSFKRAAEATNAPLLPDKSDQVFEAISKAVGKGATALGAFSFNAIDVANAGEKLKEVIKNETAFQKELEKQLIATNTEQAKQGSLFEDKPGRVKTPKDIKAVVPDVIRLKSAKIAIDSLIFEDGPNGPAGGGGIWQNLVNGIPKMKQPIDTELALLGRNLKPLDINVPIKMPDLQAQFEESMNHAFESAAINAAQGFADILGKAMSGDNFNPLAAGLELIAESLIQLGKAAVAAGIVMLNLKTLFKTPATAIIAGIAAIAVGAAIKANIPKFATGGIATKPTMGVFGEAGPEAIIPLSQMNKYTGAGFGGMSGGQVVFEIEGHKLMGVLHRVNNSPSSSSRLRF